MAFSLLTGCTVGPDFQRPQIVTPDRYTETVNPGTTAASAVLAGNVQHVVERRDIPGDWWTLFQSPQITDLVTASLQNNPTIDAAIATLRQAQELERAQMGTLFPSVSGGAGTTRQQQPQTYQVGEKTPPLIYTNNNVNLGLSYTFDFWGGLRRQVEQAHAQVDFQRFQLEAAYLTLSAGVVSSAIQAASLQQQIDTQAQLIELQQNQLDVVRKQFEIGAATGTDVAQQEAQVASAQATIIPLKTQLAQTRNQLAAYLGHAPSEVSIPRIDLDALTLPTDVPLSLPATLVEQRPDIRAAEALLHQQTAAVGVAIAQRLPNVSLSASLGADASTAQTLFTATNGSWLLGIQATQTLFDAGQLKHKQYAQTAQMEAAAAQWRNQVVAAFQNVADVLTSLQNDAANLQYVLNAKQAAERSLDLATTQYKLGGVSYLSVLSAEQTYQGAALSLIRARAARFSDTIALYQALGGGWWNRNDVPNSLAQAQ
ncbi:MAG: efflux transporter outer membrane subunit [Dyella sp.]